MKATLSAHTEGPGCQHLGQPHGPVDHTFTMRGGKTAAGETLSANSEEHS
jgi:hypothetical protein